MAKVRSNLPEFNRAITKIATCMQLTRRRTVGKTLGEAGLDLIRQETYDRSRQEHQGPSTAPFWADNTEEYKKRKDKAGKPVGVLGDANNMLSMEHLKGPSLVQSHRAEEIIGADEETRLKLEWFQDPFQGTDSMGRKRNQPPRKIDGYDEHTDQQLQRMFKNHIYQTIKEVGG